MCVHTGVQQRSLTYQNIPMAFVHPQMNQSGVETQTQIGPQFVSEPRPALWALKVLRVIRALRVLRSIRTLPLFRELYIMILGKTFEKRTHAVNVQYAICFLFVIRYIHSHTWVLLFWAQYREILPNEYMNGFEAQRSPFVLYMPSRGKIHTCSAAKFTQCSAEVIWFSFSR